MHLKSHDIEVTQTVLKKTFTCGVNLGNNMVIRYCVSETYILAAIAWQWKKTHIRPLLAGKEVKFFRKPRIRDEKDNKKLKALCIWTAP